MNDRYFDLGNLAVNNELDDGAAAMRCSRRTSAPSTRGGAPGWR